MPVTYDPSRGKKLAQLLHSSFAHDGIHGQTEMPEDIIPKGISPGSLEHVLFITLSVSIDYQRDADALWASSRLTYEDPTTRYLFNPAKLHEIPFSRIFRDMQKYKLSKKPEKDATIWQTVGVTFHKKWEGNPQNFLASCNWDAPLILARLKVDTHLRNGKRVPDYPFLRGDKISPLWLRMLRDNVGLSQIRNLEKVPIPVDIHITRATLALGVVRGNYSGRLDNLFQIVRKAWFESVEGLTVYNRPMIALDVDEPLWHLSRHGCTQRDKLSGDCPVFDQCEAKEYCTKGKISIQVNEVELNT